MVTVTFEDELEVNAVTDALNRLVQVETSKLERLAAVRRMLSESGDDDSQAMRDNTFAADASRAAIRHAMRAQLQLMAAMPEPEYPVDMTVERLDNGGLSVLLSGPRSAGLSVIERYQAEQR